MHLYRIGESYDGATVTDIEEEGNGQVSLDLSDGRVVVEEGQRALVSESEWSELIELVAPLAAGEPGLLTPDEARRLAVLIDLALGGDQS